MNQPKQQKRVSKRLRTIEHMLAQANRRAIHISPEAFDALEHTIEVLMDERFELLNEDYPKRSPRRD